MCVPRSQELRDHLSSINILDILGSQCTETPLTDCATCQSTLPSLWLDPDSCAPISPSLAVRPDRAEFPRGGMPPSGAAAHSLSQRTGAGVFRLKLQLGSAWRWANSRQREEKRRGRWRISLSFPQEEPSIHHSRGIERSPAISVLM